MTALSRVRAALAAGERPSDDDVRAVCADAERVPVADGLLRDALPYLHALRERLKHACPLKDDVTMTASNVRLYVAHIDAAIREPK